MEQAHKSQSVLLENVDKLIHKKLTQDQANLISQFARLIYRDIAADDLINRNDSDLYGAVMSLWQTLSATGSSAQPKTDDMPQNTQIRVFNPDLSQHGWQSSHTIVEIVTNDQPFLVDSIRMALNRLGITAHWLLYQTVIVKRDKSRQITALNPSRKQGTIETYTIFSIEIDRQSDNRIIDEVKAQICRVISQVDLAVTDWQSMLDKCHQVIEQVDKLPATVVDVAEKKEALAYLNWLADNKFTFLGYREYQLDAVKGGYQLSRKQQTSLGLMRGSTGDDSRMLASLPANAKALALTNRLMILTKTNALSEVHRSAHLDYVGIKQFDKSGKVIGEHRFIGLYSSDFYNDSAFDIPLIKDKVNRVLNQTGFKPNSHAYKAILNILETYPREELLHATEEEITQIALGVMQMQERGIARLFVRKDMFGRYFSCMAYVPRDRYSTKLRMEMQKLLKDYFGSNKAVEFYTYLSESPLARTHYMVRVADNSFDINEFELQTNMIELTKSWEDKLERSLLAQYGEEKGKAIARKYEQAFSRSYKENELPNTALVDIEKLESLNQACPLSMILYKPQEAQQDASQIRLKLFHLDKPIYLSDVLPMLENFGLRVIDERPYQISSKLTDEHTQVNWILDFSMSMQIDESGDFAHTRELFQQAFYAVWAGELEDDGFNRLVLQAGISGREISILRAYAKYMRQIGTSFSQSYIEHTFSSYPHLANQLIELFKLRFSPDKKFSQDKQEKLTAKINTELDAVANLDDDRIIRRFVDMILATSRTNFYQQTADAAQFKAYISLKLVPESIPDMPKPVPKFEIFVYSPKVEGVHLRGGKVARGGLRWSDRREDFRTEVLGLVKAQQVKNTVIVPVGAKGGFVCKQAHLAQSKAEFIELGKDCYRTFIKGLLDITDNIKSGEIVYPKQVVRHDEDDPYLVVAADKGTATFSDIANEISLDYDFWLADAFASGGSVGYDHKKMGITAKGAWESVKRHFRELGINCQNTDFSCVGVGDMAGDVFGNGMLLSKHICLQAAFNHLHIFIDPNPDAKKTYAERQRLFKEGLGWADYDKSLISQGGGIFERSAKSIKLTPEIKQLINTDKNSLPPNELIHLILQMKADLFWNGGIGTYIKSSKESHADVGDRANDALRVNGNQLNFKIVGEGGNLGCTQLGRIEAAKKGVLIDTDFIDNVGGVDCSDKEVNIKILLNGLVADGELTMKKRNELLAQMTDEVAQIVLTDCYRQTHSLSVTELNIAAQLREQIRFLQGLEKEGYLDRELEFLPSEDELADRLASAKGLTRPELSVLLAYGKMVLKEKLNTPEITENSFLANTLVDYFPHVLQQNYSQAMQQHPLKAEIIATQIANQLVNDMGMNFVYRMTEETGANIAEIAICFTIAREIFGLPQLWQSIEQWDNKVPSAVQSEALFQLRRTVRRATRWFLRHRNKAMSIEQTVEFYQPVFTEMSENLDKYLVESEHNKLIKTAQKLESAGVDAQFAQKFSYISTLFSVMDIAQVASETNKALSLVADVYYKLSAKMDLHWFLEQINKQPVANHWQALARATFREESDWQLRALTAVVIKNCDAHCQADEILAQWTEQNEDIIDRWRHLLADFRATQSHEFAKFSVALRELMLLSHHCDTMQ
ncbi:NAD-glutamate dehydrogenase [Catenovulum sp. 2E275]|uniref:NAD-glutamate dehydrogenase n=1 Tax=Catenovulum sp. 2E275 TaxID=2980497 RepID=UPI0021CF09C3|nr:NAD-glutamate dehydrogenase [Catenovulum sp. 2E275]MCU4676174.1 NAD-glutamate dehydrogenase [Catenovulum sp. 2E275]